MNIVHFEHGSAMGGVNFARKSKNVCDFSIVLASKVISNAESSIDHLVILSAKSGQNSMCLIG